MWLAKLKSLMVTLREMWMLFFWLMWITALMQIATGAVPPPAGQPQSSIYVQRSIRLHGAWVTAWTGIQR
jgi:hypothetical protein